MIWFTSDWHLDNERIIGYCNRPFKHKGHMNSTIFSNYKRMVAPDDTVYFLGDLSFRGSDNLNWYIKTFNKLPGTKHLILGNHDRLTVWQYETAGFMSVHSALHLELLDLYLVHDPAKTLVLRDKVWVCGHLHNLVGKTVARNIINVCVDVWDFKPVSVDDVLDLVDRDPGA